MNLEILLVVNDDAIVKVHVHTEDPGVMQEGLKYGSLTSMLTLCNQHEAQVEKKLSLASRWRKERIAVVVKV